jgi:hypothetical protein
MRREHARGEVWIGVGMSMWVLLGCIEGGGGMQAQGVEIRRFDKALYAFLEREDSASYAQLCGEYGEMLSVTGKGILNVRSVGSGEYYEKLTAYYGDSSLRELYRDALLSYEEVGDIEEQLGRSMGYLSEKLGLSIPEVNMHVSGFGQNILVGAGTLSLSIDKYLGEHGLYDEYFYDYQRRQMRREYVVRDYLVGWLLGEYPFEGRDNVLLERMVYEGKIRYLVRKALKDSSIAHVLGYSEGEYKEFVSHEGLIWRTVLLRKHLYTPDYPTTQRYFDSRPSTFLSDGIGGNVGVSIGLHIVARYVSRTRVTARELMEKGDSQEILRVSGYNP